MRILFVGIDLNRNDLLKNFTPLAHQAECFFLENFSEKEIKDSVATQIGKIIFWKQYQHAFDLLETVRPNKVVYALIDNYYHFALFFAAKHLNIPVIYIDHGIRFEAEYAQLTMLYTNIRLRKNKYSGFIKSFPAYLKHSFFRNTVLRLPAGKKTLLKKLFFERARYDFGFFMERNGESLQPDAFIIYSRETWKFHKFFFKFKNGDPKLLYTGIPALDEFIQLEQPAFDQKKNGLLIIDQPLHEQRLFGWDRYGKMNFWKKVFRIALQRNFTLYIKPHPWNEEIYEELEKECDGIVILRELNFPFIQENIKVVGGFNSTLLIGFCALDNFLTFCFTDHPESDNADISEGILKYHVAKDIDELETLDMLLADSAHFLKDKNEHLEEFHNSMMYRFDGQAQKRTIEALLF